MWIWRIQVCTRSTFIGPVRPTRSPRDARDEPEPGFRLVEPAVEPVELLGEHVQHRLTGQVAVALVGQQPEPRGPAVALDRLVEPLRLNREGTRVAVLGAVDEQDR